MSDFKTRRTERMTSIAKKLGIKEAKPYVPTKGRKENAYESMKKYLSQNYEMVYDIVSNKMFRTRKKDKETTEVSELEIKDELYTLGYTFTDAKLEAAVYSLAEKRDAFFNYFSNLPEWTPDKPDYIGQLLKYIQTTDNQLFDYQFRKMLARCIACALTYIPFNKHCFMLYGGQNPGKTSFIRFLTPPKLKSYHKESPDIGSKDGRFALARYFALNFDDMGKMKETEISTIKNYITIEKITDRVVFAKHDSELYRRANPFGTTNEREMFVDRENVRFLIFEVKEIIHDFGGKNGYAANIDIDNVWAQAFYYFVMGERIDFELSKDDIKSLNERNKDYMKMTVEMESLLEYFAPAKEGDIGSEYLTPTQILSEMQRKTGLKMTVEKVGKALSFYEFFSKKMGDKRIRKYLVIRKLN